MWWGFRTDSRQTSDRYIYFWLARKSPGLGMGSIGSSLGGFRSVGATGAVDARGGPSIPLPPTAASELDEWESPESP